MRQLTNNQLRNIRNHFHWPVIFISCYFLISNSMLSQTSCTSAINLSCITNYLNLVQLKLSSISSNENRIFLFGANRHPTIDISRCFTLFFTKVGPFLSLSFSRWRLGGPTMKINNAPTVINNPTDIGLPSPKSTVADDGGLIFHDGPGAAAPSAPALIWPCRHLSRPRPGFET